MRKMFFFFTAHLIVILSAGIEAQAQQYKFRQVNSMMGMKSETIVYVKGMRKRTEGGNMTGMGANLVTIQQCDSQRTIRINDKKKLYYIEPFHTETGEITDDNAKPGPVVKNKPDSAVSKKPKEKTIPKKGGVITTWYNITDTGERKKMHGFTARHVWTYRKMKPSVDACTMKDSLIIKTDGWYIDLPKFNCPQEFRPARPAMTQKEKFQPECIDSFVNKRSGKGKLGFPLTETTTMKMGNAAAQTSEYQTSIETLELTTAKLDSMLFEIPPGYNEVFSEDELQDKFDMSDIINQAKNANREEEKINKEQKKTGMIRIGVLESKSDDQLQAPAMQEHMVNLLLSGNVEAIAVASEEEARKNNCDYKLTTDFTKIKQGSKVGGLLKAIKNTDPNAMSSYNITAVLTLIKLSDGSTRLEQKVDGKYEGKIDDAAKKAMDEGCGKVLKELK